MKKILTILGLLLFVYGCNSQTPVNQIEDTIEQKGNVANCLYYDDNEICSSSEYPLAVPKVPGCLYYGDNLISCKIRN